MDVEKKIINLAKTLENENNIRNKLMILKDNKLTKDERKKHLISIYDDILKKTFNNKESKKFLIDKLSFELNGQIKVPCQNGIIDILTDDYIIQVKPIKKWKEAVGEVMVYSSNYSKIKKNKRIHLFTHDFDEIDNKIVMIFNFCSISSIKLSYNYLNSTLILFYLLDINNIKSDW